MATPSCHGAARCGSARLLAFFRGLDVADGVVRTAMSRLAADGWLTRTRVARNSFYRLADKGRETFARATEHIYRHRPPDWHGHFDMLLIETGAREGARAALEAAGFGMPLPGVFVAPAGTGVPEEAASALRLDVSGSAEEQRTLAARAWPLEQTAEAYRRFIATFEPLAAELQAGAALTDLEAMVARVLLIHDYRRIVLRDPILPSAILPEDWPGLAARAVCADIYGRLVEAVRALAGRKCRGRGRRATAGASENHKQIQGLEDLEMVRPEPLAFKCYENNLKLVFL